MKLKSTETMERSNGKSAPRRNGIAPVHTLDQRHSSPPQAQTATPKTKPVKKSKPNPSSDATNQEPVPLRKCLTFIEAKIDVGFGNTLFIRGDGAGLNWSTGVPLECIDASTWIWSSREPAEKIAFRLLINDDIWATSVMFFAPAGERTQVVPVFHHA